MEQHKSRYDSLLIQEYTSSITYSGLDHEHDANFVIVAKYLPKDNLPNYDEIMNNLWEFYQEQIEAKNTPKFNVFFVSGLSKLNNLPTVILSVTNQRSLTRRFPAVSYALVPAGAKLAYFGL